MGCKVANFPHQAFFRDKDPISSSGHWERCDTEGKKQVTCLSLFTSAQRGLGQLSPQAGYLLVYHREL